MKNNTKTSFALAMGASFVTGLSATAANAETNVNTDPFAMSELSNGYMNLAEADSDAGKMKMKDGACGEGKCGSNMKSGAKKAMEGKCAGKMESGAKKAMEGKCGDKMKSGAKKAMEGKCGGKK